jgi:hypothetical protein
MHDDAKRLYNEVEFKTKTKINNALIADPVMFINVGLILQHIDAGC